ncbi:MAG: hypothetical protein HZB51_28470 [Chloroflexi bacterium]|nr:hypothetical protein [Chloroflexota bacterium]
MADPFSSDQSNNPDLRLYQPGYDGLHRTDVRAELPKQALSSFDYERFRAFIQERIGLDVTEDRKMIMARALAEGMQTSMSNTLDEFYRFLTLSSNTSPVWDQLVSALTVGETYFFRNTAHFDALAKEILPRILADREHLSRRVRIWSAGCATGEEPYSVAILLSELIPNLDSWNISIFATDINREALQKARDGLYGAWSFRGVERRIQETYFRLNSERQYAIAEKIKRMVTFGYFNLVSDPYPSLANNTNAMDVILCRNVTIYFRAEVTQRVLSNFYRCLTPGGWLVPGAAEPNMLYYNEFEPCNFPGAVIYQRTVTPKVKPTFVPFAPPAIVQPVVVPAPVPAPMVKLAPLPKPPAPRDAYELALELLQAGKADEALVKLYEKLDQDATFVPTYFTLGKIFANKGNLEEAQSWCERAIKKDKLDPEPYFTLSMVYQQNGLNEMAMESLKKAIYLDRNFVMAHYNLAHLYQAENDFVAARKELQNVLRLLEGKPKDMTVPEGDGLVVGRLVELVQEQLGTDTKK